MHTTTTTLRAALLSLLVCACERDDAADDAADEVAAPTFWEEVAPIYFDRCVSCHQSGGIAPFRLDSYEDASAWASASAAAVAARTMPPWLVTDDGSCGEFQGSRALSDAEISAITAWAEAGAPEGEPRADLKSPPLATLGGEVIELRSPDYVPEADGGPLAEYDDHRCFLVDPKLQADLFLTGYDIIPGNAPIVHHLAAMPVDPTGAAEAGGTNLERMQALDAMSPEREGWPCYFGAGEGVTMRSVPVTWAPGMGAVEYPEDTGVRIAAGDLLVIQLHYNLHDPAYAGQSDSTAVRLQVADEVEREAFFIQPDVLAATLWSDEPALLEPGEPSVKFTGIHDMGAELTQVHGLERASVYGFFPHMHERGQKLRAEVLEGETERCLGDVQRWDFNWQLQYFYADPIEIGPDSRLRITCDYNTLGAEAPVSPGWGTQNEMCHVALYVVP